MNKKENSPIKIIDFGLSKVFGADLFDIEKTVAQDLAAEGKKSSRRSKGKRRRRNASMKTRAGTPYYISPEVLAGDYDESCDIWSAGVILYIILCGYPPFYGNTDREILYRVQKAEYDFDGDEWEQICDDAKDLISKMIVEPRKRLTAMEVLSHKWVKHDQAKCKKPCLNIDKFQTWSKLEKLKKIALTVIADQLNLTEIHDLEATFNMLDKNQDGSLTLNEIKSGIKKSKRNKI